MTYDTTGVAPLSCLTLPIAPIPKPRSIWAQVDSVPARGLTPHNDYGVMHHFVVSGDGNVIHIPLRIVQNGDGAEVMLTLFRQPGMTDEKFSADAKWIMRDLRAMRDLVES